MTRLAIDPVTRVGGPLRIEVDVQGGVVADAWAAATMFRGLERTLIGRDPRDAWLMAQRICGSCNGVHALASVRAVERRLGIAIPGNARMIRNILAGVAAVTDTSSHFYRRQASDWVDLLAALDADPAATAELARSISDLAPGEHDLLPGSPGCAWPGLVHAGQPGIFTSPTRPRPHRAARGLSRSRRRPASSSPPTTWRRSTGNAASCGCTRCSAGRARTRRRTSSAGWRWPRRGAARRRPGPPASTRRRSSARRRSPSGRAAWS